jgi:hypothetical protein
MTKLIMFALGLALALAEAGKLKEATYKIALLAAEAQKQDIISLGAWSRALNGGPPEKSTHHKKPLPKVY